MIVTEEVPNTLFDKIKNKIQNEDGAVTFTLLFCQH